MNKRTPSIVFVALVLFATQALAQDAGSVSFASGDVTAERQPATKLAKGDTVFASDAVITGAASRAQLIMSDGAKIAVRPDSRIVIDEYVYAASAAAGSAVSATDDSSVISLVKGGFRAITGAIGKDNPQNYEVRTAVGVLGIRGTDFAVLLCGNCDAAPGVAPGTTVAKGLYIMVSEGTIVFRNEFAELEITAGEFAFIPFVSRQPTRLDTAPPVFIDDFDFRFEADADQPPSGFDSKLAIRREAEPSAPPPESSAPDSSSQDDGSDTDTPAQPIIGIDQDGNPVDLTPGQLPDPTNRSITYSSGPLGAADSIYSGVLDNLPGQYQLDGSSNLSAFGNSYPSPTGPTAADFAIDSSTNVDTGFETMTVLRWGRWSGGSAAITLSDGSSANQDLANQSLHWVSSPEWSTPVAIPVRGVANYTLLGATSPTDNMGNTGVLGAATFLADFTNMLVDSTLTIDINGSNWTASGNGSIAGHLFQGNYGAVAVDGIGGGTGVFTGFFSAPGPTSDPSFPGGVGLTYSLQDMLGVTSISGAAAFGNP
jgi:hypothetical protein